MRRLLLLRLLLLLRRLRSVGSAAAPRCSTIVCLLSLCLLVCVVHLVIVSCSLGVSRVGRRLRLRLRL